MHHSIMQWFWRFGIKHVPTLKHAGFVRFTAFWTIAAIYAAEKSIDLAAVYFNLSPTLLAFVRVAVAWFVVYLVLWVQNVFIVAVFVRSFPRFIDRVSGLHHVTRAFGCELLRRFFEGEFDKAIFDDSNIASLPSVLQSLEAPHGCQLPTTAYALLLQKSSELRPVRVLATWDNKAFPITAVFDSATQEPNPPYARYFRALDDIYKKVRANHEKIRVFIFEDEDTRKHHTTGDDGAGSGEWAAVHALHKRWGFTEIWHCTNEQLVAAKKSVGMMALEKIDDIVYFQERGPKSGWIIGMDRDSKSVVIRQENIELDTVLEFFKALQSRSSREPVRNPDLSTALDMSGDRPRGPIRWAFWRTQPTVAPLKGIPANLAPLAIEIKASAVDTSEVLATDVDSRDKTSGEAKAPQSSVSTAQLDSALPSASSPHELEDGSSANVAPPGGAADRAHR
jgi:hypothetical protein